MSQYVFLLVKEVVKETSDAVTIIFQKPTVLTSYLPGQFLTLIVEVKGEKLRRSYSLSSSPFSEDDWAVSVKKVIGGKVSNYLVDSIKVGDVVETMSPAGIFTYEPNPTNNGDLVLIGGGSGITPLFSILKSALAKEVSSKVFLIYANKNEDSIIFKKLLADLLPHYTGRLFVHYVFSQPQLSSSEPIGRLDTSRIVQLINGFNSLTPSKALYFVCGPQGLMEESFKALELLGIASTSIRKESFTATAPAVESADSPAKNSFSSPAFDFQVSIKYGKQTHSVFVPAGQTILEAALDQKIDLPYSCQSGMCTACMGKCTAGSVTMDDPDGLSANEIKQGFVLTCVGKPQSEGVIIEIV